MLTPLRNWHNKRIREMCRVTMHQVELHDITSAELQKRIGIWDLAGPNVLLHKESVLYFALVCCVVCEVGWCWLWLFEIFRVNFPDRFPLLIRSNASSMELSA